MGPDTINWATRSHTEPYRHRSSFPMPLQRPCRPDELGFPANRGLGCQATSEGSFNNKGRQIPLKVLNGFGYHNSTRSFGHGGAGGQIGWVDPETSLSIAFVTNTFTDSESMNRRGVALSNAAGACALSASAAKL